MIIFVKFSSFFVDFCLLLCVLSICNGNFLFLFLDAPERWQFGFQDPATSIMEGIIDFHNHVMFFLILVVILVFYLLYSCLEDSNLNQIVDLPPAAEIDTRDIKDATNLNVGKWLEIVWTLFPSFILIMVALPSFALLYAIDAQPYTSPFSVKVIGHQWYWSYETTAAYIMENVDFVSNTSPFDMEFEFNTTIFEDGDLRATDDLLKSKIKGIRLLETNNRLILPVKTFLHFIITSSDVIHAWAVPSFGIKMDAIPGRLNQIDTFIKRTGTFYGQCSEICGINHGFMPICVGSVKPRYFAELMFGFYSGSLNDNVCFTENDKET